MKNLLSRFIPIVVIGLFFTGCTTAQTIIESKKFEAESIKKVEIEGSFVNIRITSGSGSMVSFDGEIEGPERYRGDFEIKSELDGSMLKIWLEKPKNVYGNIRGKWDISLPTGTQLIVSNNSGNVKASGLSGDELTINCSSGNIEVDNLAGNISLKASSGNISAFGLEGNISAKASSGNVSISDAIGNVDCKTSSGNIRIKDLSKTFLTATASSGEIYLDEVEGKLSVKCNSGNIKGENIRLEGDSNFNTTSGNISIYTKNGIEDLSFDLSSNSGDLRVGDNRKAEDRLIIKRGDILVTGRATSGNIRIY